MLYTLIGNGDANAKEVVSSLHSLHTAAEEQRDEFWMLFVEEAQPSATVAKVVAWAHQEGVYYEIVRSTDEALDTTIYTKAEEEHTSRRPLARAITLTPARVEINEGCAVLILSDDIDNDEGALFAITQANDLEIPVYDLGGQMTPLLTEEPEATPEAVSVDVEPEPEVAPESEGEPDVVVAAAQLYPLTRDELADLTAAELRAVVRDHEIEDEVSDMRSKEAMTTALLKHWGLVEPEREATKPEEDVEGDVVIGKDTGIVSKPIHMVSVPRHYLMTVDEHGNIVTEFVSVEQMAVIRTALD